MRSIDRLDNEDIDYCFTRLSANQLARRIIGDVRVEPNWQQIVDAQKILDRTGHLYRLVAGFRIEDYVEHRDLK